MISGADHVRFVFFALLLVSLSGCLEGPAVEEPSEELEGHPPVTGLGLRVGQIGYEDYEYIPAFNRSDVEEYPLLKLAIQIARNITASNITFVEIEDHAEVFRTYNLLVERVCAEHCGSALWQFDGFVFFLMMDITADKPDRQSSASGHDHSHP